MNVVKATVNMTCDTDCPKCGEYVAVIYCGVHANESSLEALCIGVLNGVKHSNDPIQIECGSCGFHFYVRICDV